MFCLYFIVCMYIRIYSLRGSKLLDGRLQLTEIFPRLIRAKAVYFAAAAAAACM